MLMNKTTNEIIDLNNKNQIIYLIDILWLTNTDDSKINLLKIKDKNKKLKKYIKERIKNPYDFINDKRLNPLKLDMTWSAFFGTGNKIYIEKIFTALDKEPDNELVKITQGAAKWSLESNIKSHEAVYIIVKEALDNPANSENLRNTLKEICLKK